LPDRFGLEQNYPNPFNGHTTIAYHLPAGEHRVSVKIYNIRGEQIRTLVQQTQSAGQHTVTWDARDKESREVASGIYLVRLQAGEWNQSKRMLYIK
jgi:flagellar hook assembly protein FlgD